MYQFIVSNEVFLAKITLVILIAFSIGSCSKKGDNENPPLPEKRYSKWTIDLDTFVTDKASVKSSAQGFLEFNFEGDDNHDGAFARGIKLGNKTAGMDSFAIHSSASLTFYGYSSSYHILYDPGTYLYTSMENGRLKITLPTTYFRHLIANGALSEDSIAIQGVFYDLQ